MSTPIKLELFSKKPMAQLIFKDGTTFEGKSFGYSKSTSGEVVFSTGMVGYPEFITDPSYKDQILVLTYPLIGNYGVPPSSRWESDRIYLAGVIVSNYIDTPSHIESTQTLAKWFKAQKVPALVVKDTRYITQKIRLEGSMLGKIVVEQDVEYEDPNEKNLVAEVSTSRLRVGGKGEKHIILIDCGAKRAIGANLLKRGLRVTTVPWDFDFLEKKINFDGIVISNGPGDPKKADKTIQIVRKLLTMRIPILGICLGNQILTLAAGGDTQKLKFGHRGQNQPCIQVGTKRCYLTTQNHGYVVSRIPDGFEPWFINANDGTVEGIIHKSKPFMSVQFHPESTPGPVDTEWIFDYFLKRI